MSRRKAPTRPRDLPGRVREVEIIAGKLVLRGNWVGNPRYDMCLSIHPEDVGMVESALTQFKLGEAAYQAERETRAARETAAKRARAEQRKAKAAVRSANTVHGIRIVTVNE